MKKFFLFIVLLLFPSLIYALEFPKTNSKIVEIYDITDNKIIYNLDSTKKSSIASLTKIVTTITAIENIEILDRKVTITDDILNTVRWDASRAGLKAGDTVSYRDLLYASMLPSGADATNSLAILSSGSVSNFVKKMNELVEKVGVENTHFVNTTGLDDSNHYSTADDMRKILEYALKNQLFKQIYTTRQYQLTNGLIVNSTINTYNKNSSINTNKIIGSKTGFTLDAGYCLSSLSNINGHDFIIITLNAEHKDNKYYNIVDTVELIDFLNKNFKEEILVSKDQVVKNIPVELSKIENYEINASNDVKKYLPSDYDINKIKIEYKGLETLNYKNKENDKIGTINYYYDSELIKSEDVLLNTKIELSISKILKKNIYLIIIVITILIITTFLILKKKKIHYKKSTI